MELIGHLFSALVFPGLLFLAVYGMFSEWLDRKFYARLQNRKGPPWFQPLADFIKLMSKEVIIPNAADKGMFKILPAVAVAAATTAILMIPVYSMRPIISFQGDLIAVVYILTIPTATFFLAGWSSVSPYSAIGSMRVLTQLFAYEIPLLASLLSPAILAGSWKISEIAAFYNSHPAYIPINIIAFFVVIVAVQGKLERVPFDIPHGETEIVGGAFTEYSGRLLGFMLLAVDIEMAVVCALVNAVFLGGTNGFGGLAGFLIFFVKTELLVFLLSLLKSLMARIRLEQMINFCWQYLAPAAVLQIIINIYLKGVLQ